MNKYLKLGILGFFIWVIPFLASFVIFPLRQSNRVLFESLMPVIVTLIVILCCVYYFKKLTQDHLRDGLLAGVMWFIINIAIDLFMFLPASPWHMSFCEYMMDIGIVYLIILMIPIGFGLVGKNT